MTSNTTARFSNVTVIEAAVLWVLSSSGVTISGGSILKLDNTAAANNTSRLKDTGTVTMNGGTLNLANDSGAANFSETTGALTHV